MAKPRTKGRRITPSAVALVGAGTLLLSAPMWGPPVARRIDFLDVRRVEISGATLVAPHEVLRVSGIRAGSSLFDERTAWENALEAHPVISAARVSWRLPNTLRVRVVEERPVALVAGETLTPATAAGTLLPVDPSAVPLDLPIVPGTPEDEAAGAAVRAALAEAGRLADLDPTLMSRVSEIRWTEGGKALLLVHERAELLMSPGLTPHRLEQLHAVLTDLGPRLPAAEIGETPVTIDLRYDDQIVVRHPSLLEMS